MSGRRKQLPPPDASGTDPDAVLRSRFSLAADSPAPLARVSEGKSDAPIPATETPTGAEPSRRRGTRPDAEGMRRVSYYISAAASQELDDAVAAVLDVLGDDVPKHRVLSALIVAGTKQAGQVAQDLAEERTRMLSERLERLRSRG